MLWACNLPDGALPEEAQGRAMTMPLYMREAIETAACAWEGQPIPATMPDCVCRHRAAHHDGFGCAEVEGTERCGCENYVAQTRDHPGSITSGDGWVD